MRRRLSIRAYDPYDEWLESLGLYRKQLARDGSCLFRAVAEQVFMTQTEHESVRALCLEYMVLHREEFEPFLDIPLDHHVFNLQNVREWGGHLEIMAMSRLFNVNFLIYREIGKEPYKATDDGGRTLMLCYIHGNHYDIVYKKEDASSRGFCQSLIYDILYSDVFKLKDVRLAVDTMLHDKEYASFRRDSANSAELKEIGALVEKILGTNISRDSQDEGDKNVSVEEKVSVEDIRDDDVRGLLAHGIPPFPYKVAKSLDPDIYRNIEYDTWNTVRREARYGPFDSNGFRPGVKVLVRLELLPNRQEVEEMRKVHLDRSGNEEISADEKCDVYHGHIQEMSEKKGPVDVYIEEIGNRLRVPYASLEKVATSSPHDMGHYVSQQQLQASGVTSAAGVMPNYKKLSGYYQKAALPVENEFPGGKRKNKGKPVREGPAHNSSIRGRSAGSPTAVGHSPRSRSGVPPASYNRNSSRGMGRGNSGCIGNSSSPSRDDFPSFSSSANYPLEGVWAVRPNANQSMVSSTPKANSTSCYPTTPQPSMLEVVNNDEGLEDQTIQHLERTPGEECNALSSKVGVLNPDIYDVDSNHIPVSSNGLESTVSQLQCARLSEDGTAPQPFCQPDPNIAYLSTPPPSFTQIGGISSPQNAAVYSMTFPPYASPTYVQQILTGMQAPPNEGNLIPSELTPPPTNAQNNPDNVEGSTQDPNSEQVKTNQGMMSVTVYQVPVMYGGYGYNQPFPFVPVMSSPNTDDGKSPPIPGSEVYQPLLPASGWGPPFMGEPMPSPHPPIPPQNMPSYHQELPVPQYPPPPAFHHERPPFPPHHRGRGRGGSHHCPRSRGQHNDGIGRGCGQRPLPPRLRRGGGGLHPERGGPRYPLHHMNNNNNNSPPFSYQRSHQYEGQPLMQMGSRKSSSENLSSQQVSGGNLSSVGVPSPTIITYVEDRPPGVFPLNTQDGSQVPLQDPMAYYPTPPGYFVGQPWMWMM